MIAAVGRFRMQDLARALELMASNANPGHDHEFRSRGSAFSHDCGWGAAWLDGDRLESHRSAKSCLEDPGFSALESIETRMALLHARRTPDRATIAIENSHPFVVDYGGRRWAFCHNGTMEDPSQLSSDPALEPVGSTDSEILFHHILSLLDTARRGHSLAEIMSALTRFTCLNCFLAADDGVTVYAGTPADTPRPRYYALWKGTGDGLTVVSSEPLRRPSLSWEPIPDGESLALNPDRPATEH
jgi:predicted glutamine amidotransferase